MVSLSRDEATGINTLVIEGKDSLRVEIPQRGRIYTIAIDVESDGFHHIKFLESKVMEVATIKRKVKL